MNSTYIIEYGMYLNDGFYKSGKIKVKNCINEAHSKVKLEKFLKKKNKDFMEMVVYTCTIEPLADKDVLDFFNGIFK
jgi:hypothetical protein